MSATNRLPFEEEEAVASRIDARDHEGRARAVDPRFNVALEASAGTGKTRVLVDRYINLLKAGVDPANILAMTFTRKAATEMRERIIATLRESAARGEVTPARWRELRDRTDDIAISTIDAFCLSLLREFPLEADLDPGFDVADETEVPSTSRWIGRCAPVARWRARTRTSRSCSHSSATGAPVEDSRRFSIDASWRRPSCGGTSTPGRATWTSRRSRRAQRAHCWTCSPRCRVALRGF
jgi:superfamily I DNA/RNA helicase